MCCTGHKCRASRQCVAACTAEGWRAWLAVQPSGRQCLAFRQQAVSSRGSTLSWGSRAALKGVAPPPPAPPLGQQSAVGVDLQATRYWERFVAIWTVKDLPGQPSPTTLHCTALCENCVLMCITLFTHCTALHCTAMHCARITALHCTILHCVKIVCSLRRTLFTISCNLVRHLVNTHG